MKRMLITALAGLFVLVLGTSALAAGPILTINPLPDLLEFRSFPQTQQVTGTVSYEGGSGGNTNLCGVKDLTVTVDDGSGLPGGVVQIGYLEDVASGNATTCAPLTSDNWAYNWNITAPGVYTVRATAKVNPSQEEGSADEEVVVLFEEDVIATFPAAPSIAAALLKDADKSARYGSGRTGGNHIADVAAEMTKSKGTDFQGVEKSDVDAYEAKVKAFLNGKATPAGV